MKARLHLQQFCDISKVTPELQPLVQWVPGKNSSGHSVSVAVYPAGTVFEDRLPCSCAGQDKRHRQTMNALRR